MELIEEEYCNISDIYRGSRESKLINQIIVYLTNDDNKGFCTAIVGYDNIVKLDSWKMNLVDYIHQYMKKSDDDYIFRIFS